MGWVHGGVQGSVPHWLGLLGVIGVSVWQDQSQSCFLGRGRAGTDGGCSWGWGDPRTSLGHEGDASPGRCLGSGPISVGEAPGSRPSGFTTWTSQHHPPKRAMGCQELGDVGSWVFLVLKVVILEQCQATLRWRGIKGDASSRGLASASSLSMVLLVRDSLPLNGSAVAKIAL